jgi:hypothetical protein
MKNWVIQCIPYDINPSHFNYIRSRWYHFHFCKNEDPTITASVYLDNLAGEVNHEISKQTSVNKKSLILSVIKKVLPNKNARQLLVELFENKETALSEGIKQYLDRVSDLTQDSLEQDEIIKDNREHIGSPELPVRTYVIAAHIYLELSHNELPYETLIRDTTALKEFITAKFKAGKLSARIADMKDFSYKKILAGKHNDGAKGQLKQQLKQIINNSLIFGQDIAAFAGKILKDSYELKPDISISACLSLILILI